MLNNSSQQAAAADTLAMAQACQDQYIAQRLPPWLMRLSVAEFTLLSAALLELLACREGLSAALARLDNLDAFTRPLLHEALGAHGELDVDRLFFRQWYTFTSPTVSYVTAGFPLSTATTTTSRCSKPLWGTSQQNSSATSPVAIAWSMSLAHSVVNCPHHASPDCVESWTLARSTRRIWTLFCSPKSGDCWRDGNATACWWMPCRPGRKAY